MSKGNDGGFKYFNLGKNFNESIDNLKRYWWEKEKRPEIEGSINDALEKSTVDKETLEIMKQLLQGTKIKKMEDYLKDG